MLGDLLRYGGEGESQPGEILSGRHRIKTEIGQGGFVELPERACKWCRARLPLRDRLRGLQLAIGCLLCTWAPYVWTIYLETSPRSSRRSCGNCFGVTFGIPAEAGLAGMTLVTRAAIPARKRRDRSDIGFDYTAMALGVLWTPFLLGVPAFLTGWARWTYRGYFG